MTRYLKKSQFDNFAEVKPQRLQRKIRGYKVYSGGNDKFERRHSWGYAKRRALLAE